MALAASCYAMVAQLFVALDTLWVVLAIGIAATIAAAISTCFAELASAYPSAPGIRTYLAPTLGARGSLVMVLLYLSVAILMAGVEAHVFAELLGIMLGSEAWGRALSLAGVCSVILLNLRRERVANDYQMGTTFLLLGSLLGISLLALLRGAPAPAASTLERSVDPGGFLGALALALFLFIGFEWVTPLARRRTAYTRLIPLSMLLAIALLGSVYMVFAIALGEAYGGVHVVGSSLPHLELSVKVLGSSGRVVAVVLSYLAFSSTFNVGLMSAAKLVYALAREGSVPVMLGGISERTGRPAVAVLFMGSLGLLSALLIMVLDVPVVAASVGVAIECVVYGSVALAVARFRASERAKRATYRSPLNPPILYASAISLPLVGLAALLAAESHALVQLMTFSTIAALSTLGAWAGARGQAHRRSAMPPLPMTRPETQP